MYLSFHPGDGYAAYHLVGWMALDVGQRLYRVSRLGSRLTPDLGVDVFLRSWEI